MKSIDWRMTILGVDVSADVEDIDVINLQLDVPNLTEYAVSEISFRLMPNQFDYSPDKSSNFFTANGAPATGHRAPVSLQAAVRGESLTTLFTGIIVELTQGVGEQFFRVVATDTSINMREGAIRNFGFDKSVILDAEQRVSGIYPEWVFPEPVTPVSDGSVSGTVDGQALTEVQNFPTEGVLDERNFRVTQDRTGVSTETLFTQSPDLFHFNLRAPLRGVSIDRIMKTVLTDYGITATDAELPQMTSSIRHWSHIARPGYETSGAVGTDPNLPPFGWSGYVTDMVRNPSNGDMFFLISHRGTNLRPQLLKYAESTDRWNVVYRATAHAEWWQLATADFETFFIMQTTGTYERGAPRFGTYNPTESTQSSPARTSILKLDTSDSTTTVFANSGVLRPQMAVHYWYGFVQGTGKLLGNNPRFGFLPETRVGFHVAENAVWYRYANSTQFGLARLRTSNGQGEAVITNAIDKFNNEASFDFTLDTANREILASHTTIGASGNTLRSRHLVYRRDMPTSY